MNENYFIKMIKKNKIGQTRDNKVTKVTDDR